MNATTDLTMERLDELEKDWRMWVKYDDPLRLLGALGMHATDIRSLIAMAKRTEASERERDALREAMVTIAKHAMEEHSCGDPDVVAALAQPTDTGGAE